MTPFSIIVVAAVLYILFAKKTLWEKYAILFSLTIAIDINNFAGYFFQIGGREITYSDVLLAVSSILAILILLQNPKLQGRHVILSGILVLCVLFGVVHTLFSVPQTQVIDYTTGWDAYFWGLASPSDAIITSQSALMIIRVVLFILNSFAFLRAEEADVGKAAKLCMDVTKFHICFALAEVVTKYIFRVNWMTQLRDLLLGVGRSTTSQFSLRGTGIEIFGLTREASHIAGVMFLFLAVCILTKELKKNKFWVIAASAIMILSMSFTILMLGGCAFLLALAVYRPKIDRKFVFEAGAVLILIGGAMYFILTNEYYVDRINGFLADANILLSGTSTFAQNSITSSKVRLFGIMRTWDAFLERPLFGFGLGTAYCNSGVVSMLSNLGLLGTLAWIVYCVKMGDVQQNRQRFYICFAILFLLPNILGGQMGMIYDSYILLLLPLMKYGVCEENAENREFVTGGAMS